MTTTSETAFTQTPDAVYDFVTNPVNAIARELAAAPVA